MSSGCSCGKTKPIKYSQNNNQSIREQDYQLYDDALQDIISEIQFEFICGSIDMVYVKESEPWKIIIRNNNYLTILYNNIIVAHLIIGIMGNNWTYQYVIIDKKADIANHAIGLILKELLNQEIYNKLDDITKQQLNIAYYDENILEQFDDSLFSTIGDIKKVLFDKQNEIIKSIDDNNQFALIANFNNQSVLLVDALTNLSIVRCDLNFERHSYHIHQEYREICLFYSPLIQEAFAHKIAHLLLHDYREDYMSEDYLIYY